MKTSDLVNLFAGGILAFVAWKVLGNKAGASGGAGFGFVKSIDVGDLSGTDAAGWQYFTNGTAISPGGDYYYQGNLVYKGQI